MPRIEVFYYHEGGTIPLIQWLDALPVKAQDKCQARLQRLEELGHELRRPEADYLRGDIYELRASYQGLHYRMLYFFHGRTAVVVSHGIIKDQQVPPREIDVAMKRKEIFHSNPEGHAFKRR